jgi:vancomycin resistance protein VanW
MLGKEYFILKRKFSWLFDNTSWANKQIKNFDGIVVASHKSIILRKLKDIDMYLQENKKTNLSLAIQHINNIIIKPNQTLSFWKLVGRPTKNKGYLMGLVLNQGKIDKDIGGGLCQLGNLMFWIFAHSPLDITQRYRHSFDVFPDINRKVPFGAGATLSYNYIDFQVKNNTDKTFQLKLWLDDTYLNGELLCSKKLNTRYEIQERNHIIKHEFWGGYTRHNQIFQIEKDGDCVLKEKLLVQNHAIMMYNPLIEK